MFLQRAKFFLPILFLISLTKVFALDSDRDQIMQLSADSANFSQKDHKGIYTGHVSLIQGSTHIRADNAITEFSEKNKLKLAIINGTKTNQAHYWADTEPNKAPVHAYADSIRYYPLNNKIELIGHAKVVQNGNSLSAAKIVYDTLKQQVITESNKTMRTTLIFYPEKKST